MADYRADTLAGDVVALIRALGEESAVVVGHDWGGAIAWTTALEHPEAVRRLTVLNCPHPAAFRRALLSNPRQMLRSWYMGFFQVPWLPERALLGRIESLFRASAARADAFTDEDLAAYGESFRKPGAATASLNYYRAAFRSPGLLWRLGDAGRRISAPTLVIWGERDKALGAELTDGMERYFSGPFRLERLPEASHWVMEEDPERVNGLLLEFLADLR